jgi:site-specific recombinase XerD
MSVTLRKKEDSKGENYRLYLDIYHNGKRNYEFIKNVKLIKTPRTPIERENNKKALQLAEQIRNNRAVELDGNEYDVTAKFKQTIDFIKLYKSYTDAYQKEDDRVHKAVFKKFETFLKEKNIKVSTSRDVTEELCFDFKEYLIIELNGHSPLTYLKRFKVFLNYCVRKKIFKESPCKNITIKSNNDSISKSVLTFEEILLLNKTEANNKEVKKAFIFALFTGLRYCDVKQLKHENIDYNNQTLTIIQEKTGVKLSLPLHPVAMELIETKNASIKVFNLPTNEGTNKALKSWIKKANIDKKITFHCARHSFATNHLIYKSDIVTISKLMGHTNLRYTQIYTQIAEDMKRNTINNLPTI